MVFVKMRMKTRT